FTQTNAIQGNLTLAAESIDLTRFYDLTTGKKSVSPTANPQETPAADRVASSSEPAARRLPFHNFTAEIDIKRLLLHDMDVADWQSRVKVDGGHILLEPCRLVLNTSPVSVSADVDLGVPGWKYRASIQADHVPVQPVADSLIPEAKGQYNGFLAVN